MIPAAFDYVRPSSLDEALGLVGPDAKILAGGQSLLPLMKLRLATPEKVVDIGRLAELRGVRKLDDGRMAIGALTTYAEMLADPVLSHYGLLRDVLPGIADVQTRHLGTIGGSVAHSDPATEMPACLLALDAEVVASSKGGERTIPIDGFFEGAFQTTLASNEIVTEIRIPGPMDGAASAYVALAQPSSGYAIAGVAAVVMRAPDGSIAFCRVAITGVATAPYRAKAVEAALTGSDGGSESIAAAAGHATDGVSVMGDIHADAAYRSAMAVVYTQRAIEAALARLA
jgi:carbon-monoxide dehydrogenase medium subunit